MSKNCLLYETLGPVKNLSVNKNDSGLMSLSGVFGVCGVRNNNKRVYETSNYSKRVSELQEEIKRNGGIPGELEHPQNMNITLENISHKITDIQIDEHGVVSGTIVLLDTPKGKIARSIVEGGLPLFISSRATGSVGKDGNVVLEKISTYDLVGTPGFSQARLHLNENQSAESITESLFMICENNEDNEEDMKEILERLEALEDRIADLEEENAELREQLVESGSFDNDKIEVLAECIQSWITDEFAPEMAADITEALDIRKTINECINGAVAPAIQKWIIEEYSPAVQQWITEEYSPEVEKWIIEEYSPVVENWAKTELADGIQKWVVEEYSPEVENWLNESYSQRVENGINEAIDTYKSDKLNSIDETLKLLESVEVPGEKKTKLGSNVRVVENLNEPVYISKMPEDMRIRWEMAPDEVKESINRRAKLYQFVNEASIKRFWENINFDTIKPTNHIYENFNAHGESYENSIRERLRNFRIRKNL